MFQYWYIQSMIIMKIISCVILSHSSAKEFLLMIIKWDYQRSILEECGAEVNSCHINIPTKTSNCKKRENGVLNVIYPYKTSTTLLITTVVRGNRISGLFFILHYITFLGKSINLFSLAMGK